MVRLDKETEAHLEHLCQVTGHSKSYYAEKALQDFLDDREDYLLGMAVLKKREPAISLEDLEKELGG